MCLRDGILLRKIFRIENLNKCVCNALCIVFGLFKMLNMNGVKETESERASERDETMHTEHIFRNKGRRACEKQNKAKIIAICTTFCVCQIISNGHELDFI